MLFWKECKKTVLSVAFLIYFAACLAMYHTQFGGELENPIARPKEGMDDYGTVEKEVPEILMPQAIQGLLSEYQRGYYVAYPIMIYKEVRLKSEESEQMKEILEELTGLKEEQFDSFTEHDVPQYLTYERFKECMRDADELIGGGSCYSEEFIVGNFSMVPKTYEEALAEYEEKMKGDNLPAAYTRLYSDYIGIDLAVLPVFVCVFFWQADKRSKINQLLYSRRISSFRMILTRYAALVFCMLVPVVLAFLHMLVKVNGLYPEKELHWLSAGGLAAVWLVPEIMIVTAVGMLLSVAASPILAIFVQVVWWFYTVSGNKLTGSITKWTLVIRHNSLGKEQLFYERYDAFVWNRVFYMLLSVACVAVTIIIYERKRKGVWITK